MNTIRLRQPRYIQVHVDDISLVESAVGDDSRKGTWIYLHGRSERRFCDERASKVREMIEEAKSKEEIRLDPFAVGLLLTAANESADGRIHFNERPDGLAVTAGRAGTARLHNPFALILA